MFKVEDIRQALAEEVRLDSVRFTTLGVLTLGLGMLGLGYVGAMTVTSLYAFGVALIVGGVWRLVNAAKFRDVNGLLLDTPFGVLETIVGATMLSLPGASLLAFTLLVGAFMIIAGSLRAILSAATKLPGWGWTFASGLVSIALGLMVLRQLPISAEWVLGAFVSGYLIATGLGYIALGLAVRKEFPKPAVQPAT
jgi:uncharacterized membrane protein HdeD (DUF308 family)